MPIPEHEALTVDLDPGSISKVSKLVGSSLVVQVQGSNPGNMATPNVDGVTLPPTCNSMLAETASTVPVVLPPAEVQAAALPMLPSKGLTDTTGNLAEGGVKRAATSHHRRSLPSLEGSKIENKDVARANKRKSHGSIVLLLQ
ncbi:hypothetical protein V6N13_133799 [Hibiscus sabdariffa]|uniref:Uncharacterized protein n=1 Tax=Hibiscus sabdariffa TaxID=183260 RepID=A0ABR2R071_9ROSI